MGTSVLKVSQIPACTKLMGSAKRGMPSFHRGKQMWKTVIADNSIIVINRYFSILASSCGMTMADFIGPYGRYGEHALNSTLHFPFVIFYLIGKIELKTASCDLFRCRTFYFYFWSFLIGYRWTIYIPEIIRSISLTHKFSTILYK